MLFVIWDDWFKRRLMLMGQGVKVQHIDVLDGLFDTGMPARRDSDPAGRAADVAAFAAESGGEVQTSG